MVTEHQNVLTSDNTPSDCAHGIAFPTKRLDLQRSISRLSFAPPPSPSTQWLYLQDSCLRPQDYSMALEECTDVSYTSLGAFVDDVHRRYHPLHHLKMSR
ncbi:Lipase member M [Manis javanica]|nr:Lipase member M [Manis javanica]